MSFSTLEGYLASAVANAGTFSGAYPDGTNRGDFVNGKAHKLIVGQKQYLAPDNFTIAFGATTWTVTWNGGFTILANSRYRLQLDKPGPGAELIGVDNIAMVNVVAAPAVFIDLGNPVVGAATGVATAQLKGAAGDLTLDGSAVVSGVAVLDVARNVTLTVATTNQSAINFTVYGTDVYGKSMIEVIAGPNANTVQGKKAFKKVTRVACSAAVATNGVSVGYGNILGLPVNVPITGLVLKELEDSAIATAGTLVAGLSPLTKSTSTTADVRGTYTPNSTPDGSKSFSLIAVLPDNTDKGTAQYSG